ncbi:unnamed protein product [Bemisia tabaci]|uniref:C2H2-type domain-containing protein n=1 Tax=Bemisia tabaci TaxID=7038 RepID=A0A9P0AHV3_BEMTA|nr:unnamed protein product [Bemisia tabaci]
MQGNDQISFVPTVHVTVKEFRKIVAVCGENVLKTIAGCPQVQKKISKKKVRLVVQPDDTDIQLSTLKSQDQTSEREETNLFRCYKCEVKFKEKSEFVAHWLEHVRGNLEETSKKKKKKSSLRCIICKKKFAEKSILKKHAREGCHLLIGDPNDDSNVSGQSKLFRCSFCDYSSNSRGHLKSHLVIHSDLRPFKCQLCGLSFKMKCILKEHQRTHSEERSFKCDECAVSFKQRKGLSFHCQTAHSDLRPHKCNVCNKRFKRKFILKQHAIVHSNLRPFQCDLCDHSTKRRSHLYRHKRIVHYKV